MQSSANMDGQQQTSRRDSQYWQMMAALMYCAIG